MQNANKIRYILTPHTLTIWLDTMGVFNVDDTQPTWNSARKLCQAQDYEGLLQLLNKPQIITTFSEGHFAVTNRTLMYQGQPLAGFIVDRILQFMDLGLPFRPLLKFVERLQLNPSRRSVEELYKFLEHKALPITDDGCFLAYKAVRADFRDIHSGKFLNTVGTTLTMPRNKVDDDANVGCSYGFHAGTLEYVAGFGRSDGHTVIVKIDPQDVVSVPHDCNCQKLRTCKYVVVDMYQGELPHLYDEQTYVNEDDEYEYDEEEYDETDVEEDEECGCADNSCCGNTQPPYYMPTWNAVTGQFE